MNALSVLKGAGLHFLDWMLNEVIPVLGCWLTEKRILARLGRTSDPPPVRIGLDVLQGVNENELERKKVIEEKARANFFGLTVGFTLLFGAVGLLFGKEGVAKNLGVAHPIWTKIFLISGFLYFIVGGMAAFRAAKIDKIYFLGLDEGKDQEEKEMMLRFFIIQNEKMNLIRSNYTDASYVSLRNGIFAFGSFIIWVLCSL